MPDELKSTYHHISAMRQRLGLESEDKSRDSEFQRMTPRERLRLICGWHLGDPNWADTFIEWARDVGVMRRAVRDAIAEEIERD